MTRVVIDTNVVVSGLLFSGVPGEIVSLWRKKRIRPFASADIIDEYIRVLAYPKFKLTEEDIDYLLHIEILPYFSTVVIDQNRQEIVRQDPTDDKFLMCAAAASARTVISGDRHLLSLGTYNKIKILSPDRFLKSLEP